MKAIIQNIRSKVNQIDVGASPPETIGHCEIAAFPVESGQSGFTFFKSQGAQHNLTLFRKDDRINTKS